MIYEKQQGNSLYYVKMTHINTLYMYLLNILRVFVIKLIQNKSSQST
jgi:hypothetical protein